MRGQVGYVDGGGGCMGAGFFSHLMVSPAEREIWERVSMRVRTSKKAYQKCERGVSFLMKIRGSVVARKVA